MKLGPVPASIPSKIGEKLLTNTFNEKRTTSKEYLMATSCGSSNHYNPRNVQLAHIGKYGHKTYKMNKKDCVNEASEVPDLTVIRLVNKLVFDTVY